MATCSYRFTFNFKFKNNDNNNASVLLQSQSVVGHFFPPKQLRTKNIPI